MHKIGQNRVNKQNWLVGLLKKGQNGSKTCQTISSHVFDAFFDRLFNLPVSKSVAKTQVDFATPVMPICSKDKWSSACN